ncbi:SDR family oxidoreductase [Maricurvus nonylphenolicus]|uniref:SDR family NAD(P)-dependent oxidoreductase n=1 Tax=Maricurvus nonylphenolicus TaxID=1008307 RepID=UPI0036F1D44F
MADLGLQDKVVIVTGAAAGIGEATARTFAEEGAKLVLADINLAVVEKLAAELGNDALALQVDVADADACQRMIDATMDRFGQVDVIFNNAGIAGNRARTGKQTLEDWRQVIDIDLNGVFYGTRAALEPMKAAQSGVIINTASVDGLMGMASIPHYTAAKHGVVGLSKATALEYAKDGIRCVAVCPGFIETDMTKTTLGPDEYAALTAMMPMGRGAAPQEVADAVVWLASNKASYVTGCPMVVDGALTAGTHFSNVED